MVGIGKQFNGRLDELSIWNKILSQSEINEVYNGGSPADLGAHSATDNLSHWWAMGDADIFPTITDKKGGSDANMVNMTEGDFVSDTP